MPIHRAKQKPNSATRERSDYHVQCIGLLRVQSADRKAESSADYNADSETLKRA